MWSRFVLFYQSFFVGLGFGILPLLFLAGTIVMLFLLILAGAYDRRLLNQIFFLQADTRGIPGAPNGISHWTLYNVGFFFPFLSLCFSLANKSFPFPNDSLLPPPQSGAFLTPHPSSPPPPSSVPREGKGHQVTDPVKPGLYDIQRQAPRLPSNRHLPNLHPTPSPGRP